MVTTLVINGLVVFLSWLESLKILKHGLLISFILLFLFLALRYNFGNDYIGYFDGFREVNKYSNVTFKDREFHYEAGWLLLCRVFKPLGFFSMVALLAAFN